MEEFPEPDEPVDTVTPETLRDRVESSDPTTVLDVRTESDYEEWHVEGETVESINVPYYEFLTDDVDEAVLSALPDDRPFTVVCAKGSASEYVAGRLAGRGYDVDHLEDGMNGWARIYDAREVTRYDGPGTVVQYQRPSSGCLSYLVVHDGEAAVVDPLRAFADRYEADAADFGADLTYALDTHVHADHVSGVRELVDRGVEGVVPAAAVDRGLTDGDEVTTAADGDVFAVGDATVEAVFTPGHTSGMTSYLVGGRVLLTGDGLFVESVARPDLEAGDEGAPDAARQLHESLTERVLPLGEDVVVGGAHFSDAAEPAPDGTYTATIGELTDRMDALSMDGEEFVDLVLADMPPRPANYEDIVATNLGREAADDEEAFAMELGPNNCAASEHALTGD